MSINWNMAIGVAVGMIIFVVVSKMLLPKLGFDMFEDEM